MQNAKAIGARQESEGIRSRGIEQGLIGRYLAVDGLSARGPDRTQFASIGEMRSGSLTERFRPCGKAGCHCAKPGV